MLGRLPPSRDPLSRMEACTSMRAQTRASPRSPPPHKARPIWMDSTTTDECKEITAGVGSELLLARRTGSRAFERFTGPQIRKFFKCSPSAYENTDRIHLVSSFLASVLAGRHAPVEPGDASGMNLMDLGARNWWP